MINLALAFVALSSGISTPILNLEPNGEKSAIDVPLKAPKSWKTEEQAGATLLTPPDVPEGKLYVVMVTMNPGKAGSLDDLLAGGKKIASEIGIFAAATKAIQSTSDGGWDYKFELGTITKGPTAFATQIMAIKKGDDGGVAIVLSDSVETMTKYADDFSAMTRAMGGSKPSTAPAPATSGTIDLQYSVPLGWVKQDINGFPLLVKEFKDQYSNYRMSLLIFPSEPISGSTRSQFEGFWNAFITPNYTTKIAPIPLMVRLKSGHACAFDGDYFAKDKSGNSIAIGLYMIVHGGRVVPVMGIYSGAEWAIDPASEVAVANFFDTATIRSATNVKHKLFDAASMAGEWSESGTEYATYVTRSGAYAGNATISTASYFTLSSNGTYSRTLMAIGAAGNIKEKDAGTWSVEDDELVLNKGGRYTLFGYGADPKIGRFLVIGNYANQRSRIKFTNPRGILQATWLKAK